MALNLTVTSTPTFATGKFGNAADTTSGYFSWGNASAFSSTTGLTIEYWAKTSSASSYQIVFGRAGNEWFGFNAGKAASSISALTTAASMADGAWHHYAWVLDGTNAKLYVDGTAVASTASTISSQFWPATGAGGAIVHVGRWALSNTGASPSYAFLGQIDELRVSKGIRYTAAFTAPTVEFVGDANTFGLYHFEADGTDSSAAASATQLANTVAPVVTGTATTGSTLTTDNGTWSATPDSYTYVWKRAGSAISGATASTYVLQVADEGQAITCTVTAIKATYTSGSATSNTVTPSAASGSSFTTTGTPTISGTATVGQVLTAATGTWAPTPDSYTYQWKRAGSPVSGATSSTYTLVAADAGSAMSVTVSAVKATYNTTSATSSATSTVAATVAGAPTSLTATAGNAQSVLSWTAPASNGGASITDYLVEYQPSGGSWTTFADGTSTATTATVTSLTNGTLYSFRVSAVNSAGTGTASTAATATPTAVSAGTILPNDTNIVYSPYNWNVTSGSSITNCSGAYMRFAVSGTPTAISISFDLAGLSGSVTYVMTVDGTAVTTGSVTSATTTLAVTIPSNGWPEHTVEIVFTNLYGGSAKWTPTLDKFVKITGLTLTPTSCTLATNRRRPYNLLCYGDSILEGYSAPSSGVTDGRLGWGYGLGAALGAEVGIVGYSGQGWTKTGVGAIPIFSTTYNAVYSGVSRSFTSPSQPDLILINMGTNDNGADITSSMTSVLSGLLSATTTSKIVIIQQWGGTLYKTTMQSVIASSSAPSRITYLDTTGWLATADTADNTHPWGYINLVDLTPRIATAVKQLLTGSVTPKRYVNVGGVATPIG